MIDIVLIYFRTLYPAHFEAAWFSLSQQDFTHVRSVIVLDNNTDTPPDTLQQLAAKHPIPVPILWCIEKHGHLDRTQSWSVNRAFQLARDGWVLITRADFLMDPTLVERFALAHDDTRLFITSWCYQMGCDAELSNRDVIADYTLPDAAWRQSAQGLQGLVGVVPGVPFQSTDADAGVYLMRKADWATAGGLNEKMVSWGYQQQAFQRALRRTGVATVQLQEYLYFHQHHSAPRDFAKAGQELRFE